jgi:biopolymer transport protein ExbD
VNFRRGESRDEPDINLIPLIDVLLVILIFLMVTTTYARYAELKIRLPEAGGQAAEETDNRIDVAISPAGEYRIETPPAGEYRIEPDVALTRPGIEALTDALRRASTGIKEPVVVINADARAAHQSVVDVMEAARRVGIARITFATQAQTGEVAP